MRSIVIAGSSLLLLAACAPKPRVNFDDTDAGKTQKMQEPDGTDTEQATEDTDAAQDSDAAVDSDAVDSDAVNSDTGADTGADTDLGTETADASTTAAEPEPTVEPDTAQEPEPVKDAGVEPEPVEEAGVVTEPEPTPALDAGADSSTPEPQPEAGPQTSPVTGHLIDYWGHALANVPVTIGEDVELTDQQGAFTIDGVAEEYDVSFVVEYSGRVYGWRYEGLTRRDPTLQAYSGLDSVYATVIMDPGVTPEANQEVGMAFGSPDGAAFFNLSGMVQSSISWRGPQNTQSSVHGLLWELTDDLPTAYLGYDNALFLVQTGEQNQIDLDLTSTTSISTGTVSGSVTTPTSSDRENHVFVGFSSGAAIEVVSDRPGPDTFTYLVPSLPNSSITVSASEGSYAFYGEYAVAHRSGIAAGASSVGLNIPSPSVPLSPGNDSTVDSSTVFKWEGSTGTFVWHIDDPDYYAGQYVVTSRKEGSIGSFADSAAALRTGATYVWTVETHGNASSVDELAGPNGFMDSFSGSYDSPSGPRQNMDGSYTISQGRSFTTAE